MRIERIESLFHDASAIADPHARQEWLTKECGSDKELLEEVASLLDANEAMERESTATQATGLPPDPRPKPPIPSATFGPYRAVELLGRGGTSAVYRGERIDGRFAQIV